MKSRELVTSAENQPLDVRLRNCFEKLASEVPGVWTAPVTEWMHKGPSLSKTQLGLLSKAQGLLATSMTTISHSEQMGLILDRLDAVFSSKLSEHERIARAAAYMDALSEIPVDLLDKAAKLYCKEGRFFPKPSELRERCDAYLTKRRMMQNRVNALLRYAKEDD